MSGMKGQDIVVAVKLATAPSSTWTFAKLAEATGLSPSQALASVGRLRRSGLIPVKGWRVAGSGLADFLVHGFPYVFPACPGAETIGVPTAASVETVRLELGLSHGPHVVWPYPGGSMRGGTVTPLHRSVPRIVQRDPSLHEMLALIDCLRVGRPRERMLASHALRKRLAG